MGLYLNEKWIYKEDSACDYCGKKTKELKEGICNECQMDGY